ncbi:MAG: chromosome segregation protein SMC [Phascolarctobacterium sp.]|nr:chromosome segregation protein SMC [Phascolarctobacterium sp.]
MRLKSFATYGFKSFADKTELTFDKGITAVVGPNGSGKSNISDAIRWVLGEQSAKYLRGSKMEDVIFSGSSKRRALGVAEVTLNFDNSDHALDIDFEEVSLTRRLFRSGDSEYSINKKSCRLKDIVDLMADTGLGKGSMSIIGQNKIDEILNSRPEERRTIFEEAAGIAKYRLRKKEAVRRLDDTAMNLTRINDIKTEVDNQVGPLSLAAEKTAQYNALSKELRQCRLTGFMRKIDSIEEVRKQLDEKKAALEAEFSAHSAVLSTKEAEYTKLQLELDKLSESYNQLQEEIKNKELALEKLRGKQGALDERIASSQRQSERLEQRNEALSQRADELERDMQKLAAEFDELDKVRAAAELNVRNLTSEKEAKEQALEEAKAQTANMQSDFFAGMQELLSLRNELRALEQEQEARVRRREALKHSIEDTEAVVSGLEEEYRNVLEAQSRNNNEGQLLSKEANALQAEQAELEAKLKAVLNGQQQCQRRLTAAETREQSLQKMQAAYEGFGYGIKTVLKAEEYWRENIIGVAAELLQVEDKYVTALETALGEGAQNIVTVDAQTAKTAINYLKANNAGRATFLPLDTVKPRSLSVEEERLANLPGVCGYAVDLVQYDKQAENAIRFLLGRVLIAENIDAALAAAKAGKFRIRVVTLDGDVVNAGGSMTGGSRKQREGYLSRAKEIQQAGAVVEGLRKEMLNWQEQLEEVEAEQKELQGKLQAVTEKLQQRRLKANELTLQNQRLSQERARENEKLALYYDDRTAVANEYMANRDKVKTLRASVQELEAKDSEAKNMLENLNKQIAKQGSELTAVDNQLQDAKIKLETSAAKTDLMSQRMKDLDGDTLLLRNEIKANIEEQGRLTQVVADCEAEKIRIAEESTSLMEALQKVVGGKDRFSEERFAINTQQQMAEQQINEARKIVNTSENKLRQIELEMTRQNSDYEHALEQLGSEYNMDVAAARNEELLEMDNKALQRLESKLTVKISDLGPINPAAIEEYQAVKERSEFLAKQYSDLCEAKENLEAVISEINSGMTRRFKEAFNQINVYFADCYVKLFGGGTALLKLSNPEDVLNSGIDIEVQPPGKRLQSLYLMSGGERALTVIALLFALLSYQPSPFCILDEIDAALDDANIMRFSNFLRDYATNTQFIIITHRKGTMECADIMYGVTMEESGVSKLLSVKISEKE